MIRIFLILFCYLTYGNFSHAFDNLLIFSLINIAFYSFLKEKKINFNDFIIFISSTYVIELFLGLPLFISVVALSLPLVAISYFVNNFSNKKEFRMKIQSPPLLIIQDAFLELNQHFL